MTERSTSRANRVAGLLLAALVVYFFWNSLYYFPYVVDDAFISLRYAYNLVEGQGLVYNTGQRIEGYSNFVWVMLQALLLALGLPAITGIKWIGVFAGLGAIALTRALARRLFAGQPLASALAVAFLCLNTSFAVWSQAGLETVFLALLLVAACLRYEIELQRENAFPFSALLFALAWMTRPEVPIYGLYFVARRWLERERRPWSRPDWSWLAAAGMIIVPYEAWGLWYYGKLLPSTYDAKIGEPGWAGIVASVKRIFVQPSLKRFLFNQGWGFFGLLLLATTGSVLGRRSLRLAAWLVPACGLIFVLYAHGDWMPRHRLFVPVLPFIALLVGYGIAALLHAARRSRAWFAMCIVFVGAAGVDYARVQMFGGRKNSPSMGAASRGFWFGEVPRGLSRREYPLEGSARFIVENLPAGETVVLRDIGFPGYLSMNPIWDTAGLVTPIAARARRAKSPAALEAMFADLAAVRPGAFRLILVPGRSFVGTQIDEWLRTDPLAISLYEEVGREPRRDEVVAVYLRRDLPEFDREARLREASGRLE